jgi:hypothetical protein
MMVVPLTQQAKESRLEAPSATGQIGTLFTFGYGKLKGPQELKTMLEASGVDGEIDTVLDVRFMPTGRNPLWRPGLVAETLAKGGIPNYQHVKGLGNPDYRSGQPASRLADEPAGMAVLIDLLTDGKNVALMCVCATTPGCHRRLIVAKARAINPGLRVVELEWGQPPQVS